VRPLNFTVRRRSEPATHGKYAMRAALLLSLMSLICGVAALFGIPAIWVGGRPIAGIAGLLTALLFAAVPPLVVLGWREGQRLRAPPNNRWRGP
jgi:hypothetical protein